MKPLMIKFYPFISIVMLQFGKLVATLNDLIGIVVFLLQLIIGGLTIWKIIVDIKKKHENVTLETVEDEVKTEHPTLELILEFFKNIFKRKYDGR